MLVSLATTLTGCVGIQFTPQERSFTNAVDDFNIQTELNARLIGESGALFANVNSSVIEGRVHLTGSVPAQEDRLKVTRIAWIVPAVREVINDIEVTSDVGLFEIARDHWITASLRALILSDRDIRDSNYTIDTENGIIYVLGIAQDRNEIERVLYHARSVSQARRVVNYAVLKDDPRRVARPGQHVASTAP